MTRPTCQVLGCGKPCCRKGHASGGAVTYRSRCAGHHRRGTATLPVGVRPLQKVYGPVVDRPSTEVIAPSLVPDPVDAPPVGATHIEGIPPDGVVGAIRFADDEIEGVVLALRLRGVAQTRIAALLGKDVATVRRVLRNARADGKINEALVDLTHQALPAAIEKLLEKIEEGKAWAIKDTLKGLGAFRSYRQQETHRETEDMRTLHVTVDMPAHPLVLNPANIVGVPRTRAQEVIDAVPVSPPEMGAALTDDPLATCVGSSEHTTRETHAENVSDDR